MTEALALMQSAGPFDVMISDLGLPDGTGLDFMREIGRVMRHAAMRVAEGSAAALRVDRAELAAILGPPKYEREMALMKVRLLGYCDAELAKSRTFVAEQARGYAAAETSAEKAQRMAVADFCHMLLSSNEFLYVD